MIVWCSALNLLFLVAFSIGIHSTHATFDQDCQPADSERCQMLNSIHAAFNKRSENAGQMSDSESDQLAMEQQLNSAANDRLGDLLDLNSEPAVEDLMRQIMSQAKMWEAIQEANREMVYQKAQSNSKPRGRFPMAFSAQ